MDYLQQSRLVKRLHTELNLTITQTQLEHVVRLMTTIGLISVIVCRTDKSITVQNPAPKADIISHGDGSIVLEGSQLDLLVRSPIQTTLLINSRQFGMPVVSLYVNVIPDENGETE